MESFVARGTSFLPATIAGQPGKSCVPPKLRRRILASAVKLVAAREEPDERWQRQSLLRRQLRVAVSEEAYERAAEIKHHLAALREELPPKQQFLLHKLQQLDFGSPEEQLSAMRAIGEIGGMDILGEVAEYLRAPALDAEAAEVLSKIWHRHPDRDPAIEELMLQGCRLLVTGTGIQHTAEAEKIFSHMIHLDPSFAEAWNKRATCRYYLGSFQDSIHDCKITIGLNGYHFGAMVGQGMCHMKLQENTSALFSFEKALQVYPGLKDVRKYLGLLRRGRDGRRDESA